VEYVGSVVPGTSPDTHTTAMANLNRANRPLSSPRGRAVCDHPLFLSVVAAAEKEKNGIGCNELKFPTCKLGSGDVVPPVVVRVEDCHQTTVFVEDVATNRGALGDALKGP
jgi:hypothetical protein